MNSANKTVQRSANVIIALLVLYALARLFPVWPRGVPMFVIVALHVVPPALIALIHGAIQYRLRGILTFVAICLLIGGTMEQIGVLTGFPYGRYYFTDVMGPKVLFVPVLLGLAYVGVGYFSWIVGQLIVGGESGENPLAHARGSERAAGRRSGIGTRLFTVPLVSTFVMLAWDAAMDPVWATVVKAWIWRDGGVYFGVPLSNFFGWLLTVYLIFQLFAWSQQNARSAFPIRNWRVPVVGYAITAVGNLILLLPNAQPAVVTDAAGRGWNVAELTAATALVSIFAMGAFAVIAWLRGRDTEIQLH